jgi:cysteine desulfurase
LYIRSPLKLKPLILGGSQENEQRAGTENLGAIAGAVRALELFTAEPAFARPVLQPLTAELEHRLLQVPGVRRWGPELPLRLANTLAVSAAGCDSLNLLAGLDMEGICASGGSACSVGALEPSHVLQALGATREEASGLVRFSLGPGTTAAEVDFTARVFSAVVKRVRNSG